ncbi:inositol monophosphatase family protein [Thiohalorhabdus methylotrophus]|uniref:Inositol-1-monophosphatase n=1 Tax=Thiohalorhabdus methylotrophus TaxID=3242694 RepID=A0ABV4TTL1_9GAMM
MTQAPVVDSDLVERVAGILRDAAAEHLLPRFSGGGAPARLKSCGGLVTEADNAMQDAIGGALAESYPEVGFLGEEMEPDEHRRALESADCGLWCLDPLDGTSNFAVGIPIFGISVALLVRGAPVLGVVLDPVRDELFTAVRGGGAFLNGEPITVRDTGPLERAVGCIDFKRLSRDVARGLAASQPFHSQRNFGSSVLEWCWLACGRVDFYLHGGQNLWDFAAGSLIAAEAGADVATMDGEPLFEGDILRRSILAVAEGNLRAELAPYLCPDEGPGQR